MIRIPAENRPSGGIAGLSADLTPLVDVLFMLIVFMVLTANAAQLVIDADMPSTEETTLGGAVDADPLTITIRAGTVPYRISDSDHPDWAAAQADLLSRIRQSPTRPVVLVSEPDAPVQRMIDVMAFLQKQGVADAQILLKAR